MLQIHTLLYFLYLLTGGNKKMELTKEIVAEIIEQLVENTGETNVSDIIRYCRDYGDEEILITKEGNKYTVWT